MTGKLDIAIVILAAGSSSRMGQPKQLLSWGNSTLLNHCITQAINTQAKEVFVVLGANYKVIASSIKSNAVSVLHNPNWEKGMRSSIAVGIKKIESKKFDGALLVLADQPQIDTPFLNKLIAEFKKEGFSIIAAKYGQKGGVPVVFSKTFFNELIQLDGNKGAQGVIDKNKKQVLLMPSTHKIEDIDTFETYEKLYNTHFNTCYNR